MPNGVKYSTTIPTGSLLKGTVALGVNGNLGPTANTGFYSMPAPASGKYIINKVAASGVPNFFAPQNDTELIRFARNEGATGANTGSAAAVLSWIATQPNLEAANFEYENIVTDGLVLNVDAGFVGSYPTINTTWYDISGNANNGALTNGPTFNSANSGSIVIDGIDDYVNLGTNASQYNSTTGTFAVWCKITGITADSSGIFSNGTNDYGLIGLYASTYSSPSSTIGIQYGVTARSPNVDSGCSATVSIPASGWLYLVATRYYNGSTTSFKLYANGALQSSGNMNYPISTVYSTWWLGRNTTRPPMVGNIAIAQMYSKELTATEVLQNYNAQKGRFGL